MVSRVQSPPLEATGEDKPMGASSVDSVGAEIPYIKDSEQRKHYFQPEIESHAPSKDKPQKHNTGESTAKSNKQT